MHDLFLRKVSHPQVRNGFRAIVKIDGRDRDWVRLQHTTATASVWTWGDTIVPMRDESEGSSRDLLECMRQFRKARDRLSSDEAMLTAFKARKLARQ
jgi:hypothetical protein